MTTPILFATGNAEKVNDATFAAKDYDITVQQVNVDIDEIQHHDPTRIAEHKARSAYAVLGKPVVINDSFWSIPALGGFPGGYMKDINGWFTTEDFQHLMKDKSDKSIQLTDVNGYFDGTAYKAFSISRPGRFIDEPRGSAGPAFAKLVIMEGDTLTISEIFDAKDRSIDTDPRTHWHDFFTWYTAQANK